MHDLLGSPHRPAPAAIDQFCRLCITMAPMSTISRRPAVKCHASNPRTDNLRRLLKQPGILKGPCCHDGLSARLIEKAGFQFAFMSGFCTAGARLGVPDTGLISYAEMVDTGRNANEATRTIPIIGDGDTGYGNAMNVKRTVRGYAQAGFAGILIEDQVAPKSCGHVRGKRVTSREEAVSRIKAAVDAREEGADILILARTDARQAESLEEALWRAAAFADAGADILFIDALESEEEMRRFCWLTGTAAKVPKMANMLEGGGKTPILPPRQLQDMGFKLVAYPLSLLGVSIRAMETALQGLQQGVVPGPDQLGTFEDIQAAVGFPEYFKEEAKYAISLPSSSTTTSRTRTAAAGAATTTTTTSTGGGASQAATPSAPPPPPPPKSAAPATGSTATGTTSHASSGSTPTSTAPSSSPSSSPGSSSGSAAVIEADAILEDPATLAVVPTSTAGKSGSGSGSGGDKDGGAYRRNRYFLVKITEQSTGVVKLETRIPAGFMSGLTALVPGVAGVNLESVVERAMRERSEADPGGALVSLPTGNGDLLQVFLESREV